MFALGIRYLNGWSMAAADGARKQRAEWPPHPDRVFMALAAAWFETGEGTEEHAQEGDALRWLQALPPPAITASDAGYRILVTSYVPVNDVEIKKSKKGKKGKKSKLETTLDELRGDGLTLLPEYRLRQPRGFPVAIPHCPDVRLIWREVELDAHRAALERLAAKVTHVGHSASFVQAWVEQDCEVAANWEPFEGVAAYRWRVPWDGRLERLARTFDSRSLAIEQAETSLKAMTPPPRKPWRRGFPDAVLLADEKRTRRHAQYAAAKAGDDLAAANLVDSLVEDSALAAVRVLVASASKSVAPVLVCAHAYEREGVNAIPAALSELLGQRLGLQFNTAVVQSNVVSHTGADGYGRLARQARFEGDVDRDRKYLMVDDFIGQGGTLANLRGWIEKQGGAVVGAVGLTGKPYSAKLSPSKEQLHELGQKHGADFEKWWREHFGHAFNCLTQSEARYLARSPDVDTIRSRLAAAERVGDRPIHTRSAGEQEKHIRRLKSQPPRRPVPGRWQGYGRPRASSPPESIPHSVFDPRLVVLAIAGKRVSLPATLKLTAALRGLLMRKCPEQPPPEWFSGHRPDGKASAAPHLALAVLPFVGAQHAAGRILGLALILPRGLASQEAGRCLEPILQDPETGLPREDLRLFDGDRLECSIELETHERPANLDPRTWTRASRVWASVTPVVLNRHFDGDDRWERSAESVKDMCGHVGLPRPREVLFHPVSRVEGVPHAREFPQLARKHDGGRRRHGHAVVVFDEPVCGPVLIGAGRFRGYGLCRPIER